jgi:tRNA threonylcarbamoyl adenosine modification protein YjeE
VSEPAARRYRTRSESETEALGARLGAAFQPSAERAVVAHLCGELGSGKTTLVRGLLQGQGASAAVRSPTYTLLERYDLPRFRALHVDLYRLAAPAELHQLGLADYDVAGFLWLIEWPERAATLLAMPDLTVQLSVAAADHEICITAGSDHGARWLDALN